MPYVISTFGDQIEGLFTYFRAQPIASLDATLRSSTLPNTNDDGIVGLGSDVQADDAPWHAGVENPRTSRRLSPA